jgi:hypothetical protein
VYWQVAVPQNSCGPDLKHVSFETEKVTDVVIDQDTLDLTCIQGPQWFARDFKEQAAERAESGAEVKSEERRQGKSAKSRKRPDPLRDCPDEMENSLAGSLLKQLGLVPRLEENADECDA